MSEEIAAATADLAYAALKGRIAELEDRLSRMVPDDFETPEAYLKDLAEENTLFTYQAAEARGLLREILASSEVILGVDIPRRIRIVLDDPDEATERAWAYRNELHALKDNIAQLETQLGDTLTSLASLQERETTLLVELSKARGERAQALSDAARWKENARYWYAQRDDLRDAAKIAAAKLPYWPDTAASILSRILEETNTNKDRDVPESTLLADAAEWEALYTAALVDLHRARADGAKLREALEAADGVMWMAERYADGGGSHSVEVADYHTAQTAINAVISADHPGAVSLLAELEAARGVFAAAERYLDLNSECDYIGGEPEVCPGIAAHGHPCHWCQLRATVAAYVKARRGDG